MKVIGLIGGMSWNSTLEYYRLINEEVSRRLGGLHDFSRLNGLSLICPCHCTQHKSEPRSLFPEQYGACGVGLELEL